MEVGHFRPAVMGRNWPLWAVLQVCGQYKPQLGCFLCSWLVEWLYWVVSCAFGPVWADSDLFWADCGLVVGSFSPTILWAAWA
jgi:hypothetical protein